MNEIEMIEAVQKELSKQYLKVAELQAENEKLIKENKKTKKKLNEAIYLLKKYSVLYEFNEYVIKNKIKSKEILIKIDEVKK